MNVLFLTHRLPFAPDRGDRIRAYHLMAEMSRFASVSLVSLVHDDREAAQATRVPFAARVHVARVPRRANLVRGALRMASTRPLTHSLLDAPGVRAAIDASVQAAPPDLVVAYCSGMARLALEPPLSTCPTVIDMVDVDSVKWAELARRSGIPMRWVYAREARTLAAFERRASERARVVLVVNEREHAALEAIAPGMNIRVISNGIDVGAYAPTQPASDAPVAVFCGVMDYAPNVEAVRWFAAEVWPLVRVERPDARFVVVGANPTRAVKALADRDPSIRVTGRVPTVQPHLWTAALAVAPLRLAQGVQNKVLEALAAGLPVVITPAVAAGLPPGVDRGCLTADDPAAFARAVVQLLNEAPTGRRARAVAANVEALDWPAQLTPLQPVLENAAGLPN